jgi:O-acetyl-ADP-ribose deacetylase (regulator of RNase III)
MNTILTERIFPNDRRFQLVQGDLTLENVDAIVNAANAYLQHGGGVAGAILRRGGYIIQEESDRWVKEHGPVSHSQPAYTTAGSLPCRYVIHAVGPVWGEGGEDEKLRQAVEGSLMLAEQLGLNVISLPPISTGIFGFPKDRAARIILNAVAGYLQSGETRSLKTVRLTIIDQPTLDVFHQVWQEQWGE